MGEGNCGRFLDFCKRINYKNSIVTFMDGSRHQETMTKVSSHLEKKNGGNGFNKPKNSLVHSPTPEEVEKYTKVPGFISLILGKEKKSGCEALLWQCRDKTGGSETCLTELPLIPKSWAGGLASAGCGYQFL